MIYRTPQLEIDAYFDSEYISNSKLKTILKGMEEYNKKEWEEKKLYYEEKGHFIIGNGVDVKLTQGKESFNEQFYVSIAKKPADKGLSIIMYLYDRIKEDYENQEIVALTFDRLSDEDILLACDAEEYYTNRKALSRISEVKKNEDFFNELCISYGKQIISYEDMILIDSICNSLKTNPLTMKLFLDDEETMSPDIDIYYQTPLYFTYRNHNAKALIDIIVVNHVEKTINVIDLKTMGGYTSQFMYQAMKMRYDIQACWYTHAITLVDTRTVLPTIGNGYTFEPFTFVVESTKVQGTPVIYECDNDFIAMGQMGRPQGYTTIFNERNQDDIRKFESGVDGIDQAFELYLWHEEHGYQFDKDYVEGGGLFKLGWNRKEPIINDRRFCDNEV